MKRLRNRLILAFFAATILPTAAILWTSVALIEHSLTYVGTEDLDLLSKSLQGIAREYYRQTCNNLKEDAERGVLKPARFAAGAFSGGPASLEQFWDGRE